MQDLEQATETAPEAAGSVEKVHESSSKALDAAIESALTGGDAPADDLSSKYERDDKGRFAPKTAEEAATEISEAKALPKEAPTAQTVPRTVANTAETPNPAELQPTDGHFRGWTPEQRAKFDALPPEARTLVLEKQTDWQRSNTELTQFRKAVEPLVGVVNQYHPYFQQLRVHPVDAIGNLIEVEKTLRFGDYETKTQLFAKLAQDYGIPFAPAQPSDGADPSTPGSVHYPLIHDMRTKIAELEGKLGAYQRQYETAEQESVSSQVQSFAAKTNPDGTPAHPLFERVKPIMSELLKSGQARTLEDAYAAAVKPIQDAIDAEVSKRTQAQEAARQAAIEKARGAAPVRTTPVAPNGAHVKRGLDAVLSEAIGDRF